MRRVVSALMVAAVATASLAFAGCAADYDHTAITNVKPSPLGGGVNFARVEVPVGMLVTAHIINVDDDKDEMKTEFRIKDSSIVDVQGVVSDSDYAFFGLRPGTTEVEIRAEGKLVLIITAIVSAQPPLP